MPVRRFCRSEDGLYGTRSNTLVITEHGKRGLVTTVASARRPVAQVQPCCGGRPCKTGPTRKPSEANGAKPRRAGQRRRPKALARALFDILEAAPAELDGTLPPTGTP